MIEKFVLLLIFSSPHVTTTESIPMNSRELCEGAAAHITAQYHSEGRTRVQAMCLQASRHSPEDRLKDVNDD